MMLCDTSTIWNPIYFSFSDQDSVVYILSLKETSNAWMSHSRHPASAKLCVHWKPFIFSSLPVYVFAYFYLLLLSICLFLSLSLSLHPHTQTQTNTAVTVAYYSGQVRACRWGLLNAGATVHQCLRNRGTCCDHRWRLAVYTRTHAPPTRTHTRRGHAEYKRTVNANRHTL